MGKYVVYGGMNSRKQNPEEYVLEIFRVYISYTNIQRAYTYTEIYISCRVLLRKDTYFAKTIDPTV